MEAHGTGTILDDDEPPAVSIDDASVVEEYRTKIEEAGMPEEAREQARRGEDADGRGHDAKA